MLKELVIVIGAISIFAILGAVVVAAAATGDIKTVTIVVGIMLAYIIGVRLVAPAVLGEI